MDTNSDRRNNEPVGFQKLRINSYPRPEKYHGLRNGLRAIEEIPTIYRQIFSEYQQFNKIQSRVFDDVLYTNKNVIVSAPTGSGKTSLFELAIIQLLMKLEDESSIEDFKIVYIAPMKALCTEKYTDWCKKFNPIGLSCLEVTGDSDISDFSKIDAAQLIVTTPEKWDSITRRWKDHQNMVESVKLFMIDEVHLINEDVRGPILEAIVSRMKTIHFSLTHREMGLRFIAVSATIPNIEDMAIWFGGKKMARYHRIAEELRPVELVKHVLGYNTFSTGFKFDMSLNYKLGSIVRKYSNKKPTLIFCSSRKAVEMAATVLYKEFSLIPLSNHQKSSLLQISKCIEDHKLKNMVTESVAFHHAGLSYNDRNIIEDAFRKSLILVLVCTSTLAMGVNLPAHLVIIKSTETFVSGSVLEYSESAVLQMIGRAGRPQFDVEGVAVIMTQERKVKKYQNLINGCTPVESHLHKHLAEHLNSEIVLQTIINLEVAMKWIRSTFLYVRAVKSPMSYGLANGMTRDNVEKKLEDMCLVQINALKTHGLVSSDKVLGICISSTVYGRLMARYYISFETMKLFKKVRGDETFLQILNTIVSCKEFSELKLRVSDKKSLNELNNTPIRYPIKGRIKTTENKISCLIQSILGNLVIKESSLTQDAFKIIRIGERISKCLMDYIRSSEKELNGKIYKALLNSTIISKCIRSKLWEDSVYVCKQLKKIGSVYSTLLVNSGKNSFEAILETQPRNLEMILNKAPPFGNEIHDVISSFPNYDIQLHLKGRGQAQIIIKQINEKHKSDGTSSIIIIGDSDNNLLFYHDKVDFIIAECGCFDRTIQIKNFKTNTIHAHLIHEKLVGLDKTTSIILNPNTEDDFERKTKTQPKRKIQSKLKLKKIPRKTTTSVQESNAATTNTDPYISLFEDNDLFENIEENLLNNSQNKNESFTIENQEKEIDKPIGFKRKLRNFEYMPNPKIPKTYDKENDMPVNLNDIPVNLDDTNDTGYDEHNSQNQENTDMKSDEALMLIDNTILQATQLVERINNLDHIQEKMRNIRPNTPTNNSAESNSCKKQKHTITEACYSHELLGLTKYLYESCDKSQQDYENSQQNKNDDEKLILTQKQNFLKKYNENFSDIESQASYNNVPPPILNVYSKNSNEFPTQVQGFQKASDYMTNGSYSSPYKYRGNISGRKSVNKSSPYLDSRNSQKFNQQQNRLFNDTCSPIIRPNTNQILDENFIQSRVSDLSKKIREDDQSNKNLLNHSEKVSSTFRLGLNNPIDFSKKLHDTHQMNEENSPFHKLPKFSGCNIELNYRIEKWLENCPEPEQYENEIVINLDSKEDRPNSLWNRCTDRRQNLDDPKVISPYFQNNTFFKNPDHNNITENENNFINFPNSQNSSDHLKSTFEKVLPKYKNINNLNFKNNVSDFLKTPPKELNQSKKFNDEDFKFLSEDFETETDTEQESSSRRNISRETDDGAYFGELNKMRQIDDNPELHENRKQRDILKTPPQDFNQSKEFSFSSNEPIWMNPSQFDLSFKGKDNNDSFPEFKDEDFKFLSPDFEFKTNTEQESSSRRNISRETDDRAYVGEYNRTRPINDYPELDKNQKQRDILKTPPQEFNQSKEFSFSSNEPMWMNPSQFDLSFKGKDNNDSFPEFNDEDLKFLSGDFEFKTDTEQESSSRRNISRETDDGAYVEDLNRKRQIDDNLELDGNQKQCDILKTPPQEFNQSKELSFPSKEPIWLSPSKLFDFSFKGKDNNDSFSDVDDKYFKSLSQVFETKTDTEQESSSKRNISTEPIDDNNNIHIPPPRQTIRKLSQEEKREIHRIWMEKYNAYFGELNRTEQIDDNPELDQNQKHHKYRKDVSTKSSKSQNSRIRTFYENASNCQHILRTGTNRLNKIGLSLCDSKSGLVINKFNIPHKNFNISNMKPLPEDNDNDREESINEYITESAAILAGNYVNKQNFDKTAKLQHNSRIVRLPDIDKIKNMKLLTENANNIRHKPNENIIKKSPTFRFGYLYNRNPKETTSRNFHFPNNNRKENNNDLNENHIDRQRDPIFDKMITNHYAQNVKYNHKEDINWRNRSKKPESRRLSEFTKGIQNEKSTNTEDLERKKEFDYIRFKYDNNFYDNEEDYFKDLVRCKFADISNFREPENEDCPLPNIDIYSNNHSFHSTHSLNKNDLFLSWLPPPHAQEEVRKCLKKANLTSPQTLQNDDFPLNFSSFDPDADFIADFDKF